jgi:hypothetical protein
MRQVSRHGFRDSGRATCIAAKKHDCLIVCFRATVVS